MHIKSITLEGFKSYEKRTHIDGFDPFFNAITGLNGSGKSNILDGICFVLGITNLSQVRATNLQELVYKSGQAGITKASVSITFDNSNRSQSPVGYDQYDEITVTRQVVIGGRNKYLINGCNAQNSRVQDLFRSVQLNVNNPHFLIMQGRITKVLNMKPPEILSMIEEAAGTKMYESKKQAAEKTVEKKDEKLREIDSILAEDITPTLTKLRGERAAFLEYQKIHRELEHLNKFCIAYQYVSEEELCRKSKEDLSTMALTIKELEINSKEMQAEVENIQELINEQLSKKNTESGGKLNELEKACTQKRKEEAKISSNVQSLKDNLNIEKKKRLDLEKQHDEDASASVNKSSELKKTMLEMEKSKEEYEKDNEELIAARNHFQAVSSGLSSNTDGQEATLTEQLIMAKDEIANAKTERKQAEMTSKHAQQTLKSKETELKKTEAEYKRDQAALEPHENGLKKLESQIGKLDYQEGTWEELMEKKHVIQRDVANVREKLESMELRLPDMAFEYSDPQPNFDRRKVKGLVYTLFTIKDPKYATALEVVAGGRLYNVIVDNETTGKLLLSKGNLKRRHTIIPLNKIQGWSIRPNVLETAQKLVGKENVVTALSLINYDRDLHPAMEYVFGNALICTDMNVAKKVTYDKAILKRSVTLDGEVFDPAGTLSGGSRKPGAPILMQLAELKSLRDDMNSKVVELREIETKSNEAKHLFEKFTDLKRQFELQQQEFNLVKRRLEQTNHHQKLEEITKLRETIGKQEEIIQKSEETEKKATAKVKEVEDKLNNAVEYRKRELKEAEERVSKCQEQMESSSKAMKDKQQIVESLKLEEEDIRKFLASYEEQIKTVDKAVVEYEKQIYELNEALLKAQKEVEETKEAYMQHKEYLKSLDGDITTMQHKQDTLLKDTNDNKLKIKKLQMDINEIQASSKESAQKVQVLLRQYEWIAEEKKYFGLPDTAYDFNANNPEQARSRLHKLKDDKERLSHNVNTRAMAMLEKTEEQYNDLINKKKIVENDKATIAMTIQELDEKKKMALQTAWQQVNEDFGSIFVSLLPGTQAKLVPSPGKTVLDGLEFKVAFGNQWKESLNELSGGQRSLVALSLILAMLRFKPAPIYILDEVDAALDLSHTQNIGTMLRTHFKHSQFVIVSLKDGMFNNANILFKTRFVDGTSTVSRHALGGHRH